MSQHVRARIVNGAMWLVAHNKWCTWSEGGERMSCVDKPYAVPFVSDCSSGVTDLFSWGGANDPSKLGFKGSPYTGTLLAKGKAIQRWQARSADVVIFGPNTGWHACLVLKRGPDPLLWSMGEQGDPRIYPASIVHGGVAYAFGVSVANCPVRYLRFDTSPRPVPRVLIPPPDKTRQVLTRPAFSPLTFINTTIANVRK